MSRSFVFITVILSVAAVFGASIEDNERQAKALLSVVRFANGPCEASNGLNGTCLSSSECSGRGGTASGTCASQYGVCCTLSIACGASTTTNNTYLTQAATTSDSTCQYTVCPINDDICQIRIDFEKFVMAGASTTAGKKGQCDSDTMVISNPSGPNPSLFCGVMTGQHIYMEASSSCHTLMATIGATDTSTSREWSMRVSQIECDNPLKAPTGCLQYLTETSGYIYNFGWSSSSTTTGASDTAHQNNQDYRICFRKKEGYCSMEYWAETPGFALSASTIAARAEYGDDCDEDYITIPGFKSAPSTAPATLVADVGDRVCGRGWTYPADAAPALTLVTYTKPFSVGVHFDDDDETTNDDQNGFAILYTQKACA